jgi:hypothetical protein
MYPGFNISTCLSNIAYAAPNALKLNWGDAMMPNLRSSLVYELRSKSLVHEMQQIVQKLAGHQALKAMTLKYIHWTDADSLD